jgi:hypothetical protein
MTPQKLCILLTLQDHPTEISSDCNMLSPPALATSQAHSEEGHEPLRLEVEAIYSANRSLAWSSMKMEAESRLSRYLTGVCWAERSYIL